MISKLAFTLLGFAVLVAIAATPVMAVSANDQCANPQAVTVGSVTNDTTTGETADAAPFCGTSDTAPGVWFTVPGDGTTLTASTCETVGSPAGSSNYDSKISVYCADCPALTCVGGNDDSPGCNFHSAISFCSGSGSTYRILVHGFGTATGNFGLSVTSNGSNCVPTVACGDGACCVYHDYGYSGDPVTCSETSASSCAAQGGVFHGEGTTCLAEVEYVANPALAIPDNNFGGVNSTINVPDSFQVQDVNVDLGINHTWVSDLIIEVTGPTAASQVLWNQVCSDSDNINATADDEGTEGSCAVINAGPIDSVFFPPADSGDGPLSVFDGTNAQGNWTLNVADVFAADFGTLNQWSLHFSGAPICFDRDYFSTSTNQFAVGNVYLRHQNVYSAAVWGSAIDLVASFLPASLGLDALDVDADGTIWFSTAANGFVGNVYLRQENAYGYNPGTGAITQAFSWGSYSIGSLDALDRLADGSWAFSTLQNQTLGNLNLRNQNVYRYVQNVGITLLFNGQAIGLSSLDAVDVLPDGSTVFSAAANQFVNTPTGQVYVWHQNAYRWNPANGAVTLVFNGQALRLDTLDALSLARGIEPGGGIN